MREIWLLGTWLEPLGKGEATASGSVATGQISAPWVGLTPAGWLFPSWLLAVSWLDSSWCSFLLVVCGGIHGGVAPWVSWCKWERASRAAVISDSKLLSPFLERGSALPSRAGSWRGIEWWRSLLSSKEMWWCLGSISRLASRWRDLMWLPRLARKVLWRVRVTWLLLKENALKLLSLNSKQRYLSERKQQRHQGKVFFKFDHVSFHAQSPAAREVRFCNCIIHESHADFFFQPAMPTFSWYARCTGIGTIFWKDAIISNSIQHTQHPLHSH